MREDVKGLLWPVVDGKETPYRFNTAFDPYAKEENLFYGPLMKEIPTGNLTGVTDKTAKAHPGKAKIFFRPYAAPELHRAAPSALLYMHPADAEKRGLKRGDTALVESRYGECRAVVETQARQLMPKGSTWLAFFDEKVRTNSVCIDATDPISLEPDYKKTAVRVKKA